MKTEINGDKELPTTKAQRQIALLAQIDQEGQSAYNEACAVELEGPLNRKAFESAVKKMVDRRDNHRITISHSGESQIIHANTKAAINYYFIEDLERQPGWTDIEVIDHWMRQESAYRFDLKNGPLYRICIVRISEYRHVVLSVYFHAIADGWAIQLAGDDIASIYNSLIDNSRAKLEEAVSFKEYTSWLDTYLDSETSVDDREYWTALYRKPVEPLMIPRRPDCTTTDSYAGDTVVKRINKKTMERVITYSSANQCSLSCTLYAAYTAMLHIISGQEESVVAIPFHGRSFEGGLKTAGCCTSLLPIRNNIRLEMPFDEHLKNTHFNLLDAIDHSSYPYAELLENLVEKRLASAASFVRAVFNFDSFSELVQFNGLTNRGIPVRRSRTPFDLSLNINQRDEDYYIELHYKSDLYDRRFIERFCDNYMVFIQSAIERPGDGIGDQNYLTEWERNRLLVEFNNTQIPYPTNECIHSLIEKHCGAHPDDTAVIFEGSSITYQELNARSNQLAHYLVERGVKPDTFVGVYLTRSLEMMIAILGIWKAGGAYVPLDPASPEPRLRHMLENADVNLLLTEFSLGSASIAEHMNVLILDEHATQNVLRGYTTSDPNPKELGIEPRHAAYMIYTSGSTGQPKGVVISHTSLVNLGENLFRKLKHAENGKRPCWAWNASYSFDASLKPISQIAYGVTLNLIPELVRRDTKRLKDFLKAGDITVWDCTPAQLKLLLDSESIDDLPTLVIGGDRIGRKLWKQLVDLDREFGVVSYNVYGPTEACVDTTICRISESPQVESIGRFLGNVVGYVANGDRLAPIDVPGELFIGGVGLAKGYYNSQALTTEKFVINPFVQGSDEYLYRSGDRVRIMEDGRIEFLGRIDSQVKKDGYRLELGEVEAQIASFEAVTDCAVVLSQDAQGDQRLVAYLVPTNAEDLENQKEPLLESLRDHIRQRLPGYMMPAIYVVMKALPLNANNKIDRNALPPPDRELSLAIQGRRPSDDMEQRIAKEWEELLGLDNVGMNENFFDLGGTSLKLMKLKPKLEENLKVDIDIVDLFANPSIESLSRFLKERTTRESSAGGTSAVENVSARRTIKGLRDRRTKLTQ